MFDIDKIRKDFPILNIKVNGKPFVYLDSAATSQKPNCVIDKVVEYYKTYNSNIHRGMYSISIKSTEEYVRSKELAAKLINVDSYRNILYNRNTTEGLNFVALSYGDANVKKGDRILISPIEHHSNIVPWQLLAKRKGAKLEYMPLTEDNNYVDMERVEEKLKEKPKIVAFTHVSNVLGSILDAKKLTRMAHDSGAVVAVDGAQAVPHMPVDVKEIDCDFYAFSSHKMLGPAGVGILYGRDELLEGMEPVLGGGDMIRSVELQSSTWNELPWKFEAGTPNIEGAIGLGAAIEYLNRIGLQNIHEHEIKLTKYALKRLGETKGIRVYGPGTKDIERRGGTIAFNVDGAHPHDVSTIFDTQGIAIRAGHHCAMPLVTGVLKTGAVARMSFYLYNKEDEVDRMVDAVGKVREVLKLDKRIEA